MNEGAGSFGMERNNPLHTQNQSTALVKQENTGDKNHPYLCQGCNTQLDDILMLKAGDSFWHQECMRCQDCGLHLEHKCFIRDGMVLCSDDFFRRYGPICSGCNQSVHASEIVRKIKSKVFHLDCLSCASCKKKLDTGDHFYMMDDGRVICKDEYMDKTKQDQNVQEKTKRARTFINTAQLTRLKHAYYNMPKPTLLERQRIAKEIGLDMRVVQVWFQNRRAKDRRNLSKPLHPLLQGGRRGKHARSKTWSAGMSRGTEMNKDDDQESVVDISDYNDLYQSREDLSNSSQSSHLWRSNQSLADDVQTVSPSSFTEEHFDFEAQSYSTPPVNNVRTMTSTASYAFRGMDNNRLPNLSNRIEGFASDSRMFGHNYNTNFPYWNSSSMNASRFSTSGNYDTMPTMATQYFQSDKRNSANNGPQYHNTF